MQNEFNPKDCPNNLTIQDWIIESTDISNFYNMPSRYSNNSLLSIDYSHSIDPIIDRTWLVGASLRSYIDRDEAWHSGLSLHYNPNYIHELSYHEHGLSSNPLSEGKNSYVDSMSFYKLNTLGTYILSRQKFLRSIIRSKISIVDNRKYDFNSTPKWHVDESIFFNLKLTIPVTTDPSYIFEIKDQDPIQLATSKVYTWPSDKEYRISCNKRTENPHIHLELNFCPWFDCDKNGIWKKNKFYGEIHPLDMLIEGHISHVIKGLK